MGEPDNKIPGFLNSETSTDSEFINSETSVDSDFLNSDTSAETNFLTSETPSETPIQEKADLDSILEKASIEDTEIFDGDEMAMPISHKTDEDALKYSYHDNGGEEINEKAPSIMDLLNKRSKTSDPLLTSDTDSDSEEKVDINSRTEGKTLDELLKTTIKDKEEWHESKKKSIVEKKTDVGKFKKLKLTLIVTIIIIFSAAIVVNFFIKKQEATQDGSNVQSASSKKLKIPANLKDEKELQKFYRMGYKLYKTKKYKESINIFSQLLRTGWKPGLINGMLGECKYKLKDEKSAKKYYTASLSSGYKEKLNFALQLATIDEKEGDYPGIIKTLEPFLEKYGSDQKMQLLLATAYSKTGNIEKTVKCYKKINPALLSEAQLVEYAGILEKQQNKDEAFKVYLMIGKLYGRSSAYIKAEQLAPDEKTRMSLLAKVVSKTSNTPKGNYYKMLLGVKMIKSGKPKEGVEILKSVKTSKLKQREATQYLMMLPYFKEEPVLRKDSINILNKYYSEDFQMNQKVMSLLLDAGKRDMGLVFFRNMHTQYPKNAIASYMYAELHDNPVKRQALYSQAISLSPNFYQAKLALGILYINKQEWKSALKILYSCEKQHPYAKKVQYYLTITKINLTHSSKPLKKYEAFLKKIKTPEKELRKEMVLIAEHMPVEEYALVYLKQAEKIPELSRFCKEEKIKIKLMYRTIKENDFTDKEDPLLKKYYIIYLMGKGEFSTVMNLPVKREDAPSFWKLLIRWKKGISSWKQKSYMLLNKNRDNLLFSTIAKLWLKKIKISDAEKVLNTIDYIDKPLLAAIIGEQYRKNGVVIKSKIFYHKALTYPNPNIYVKMVNYMRKH